jgi:hypothetical protein
MRSSADASIGQKLDLMGERSVRQFGRLAFAQGAATPFEVAALRISTLSDIFAAPTIRVTA